MALLRPEPILTGRLTQPEKSAVSLHGNARGNGDQLTKRLEISTTMRRPSSTKRRVARRAAGVQVR